MMQTGVIIVSAKDSLDDKVDGLKTGADDYIANPVLLECMLKNLIVNAIRHSASGGGVRVTVGDSGITVSNESADGTPLDTATVFHRFRTGDVRQKGNGLGLAIVKAVCDFHGWTVEYRFETGHHVFAVACPYI